MFLFLDTETSNFGPTARILSICWLICDDYGRDLLIEHDFVTPGENLTIHRDAFAKHGITEEIASERGIPIKQVLTRLYHATTENPNLICVGHNLQFDLRVVLHEYDLLGSTETLSRLPRFCTMAETRGLCSGSNSNGKRRSNGPNLQDLHRFLFEQEYAPAHDAAADTRACARCFFELDRRGLITRPLSLGYN